MRFLLIIVVLQSDTPDLTANFIEIHPFDYNLKSELILNFMKTFKYGGIESRIVLKTVI